MRKVYSLLVACLLLGSTLSAQVLQQNHERLTEGLTEARPEGTILPHYGNDREVLWTEDFADGLDSENGTWTTEGPNGDIWLYTDTVFAGCWSGSGDDAVTFTSRDNGFMIFHADYENCNDNTIDPPIFDETVFTGSLISPSIDLTDADAVLVSFEQRFRYCCAADFELRFSVSTDGGDSWTGYDVTGGTPVNDYNTEILTSLNISQVAANASDVLMRFEWNATQTASHYFWAIDDITVEIPVENDMKLVDFNYQQFDPQTAIDYTDVKYTIYHVDQIRPLNLQGFAVNNGASEQTGVVMSATINTPVEMLNFNSDPQSIAVGDTGVFEIPYTPSGEPGTYEIIYSISQDNADENPDDNADTLSFVVDENFMARDERSRDGVFSNYVDDLRTGLMYTLTEEATVYGIAVGVDNTSDVGTFFNAQLLNEDFDFLTETEFAIVEESMFTDDDQENLTQLVLEAPYSAAVGETIVPAFVFFGGEEVANISLSGFCPDFSCYVWMVASSNGQECDPCYYNSLPMVRPILAETVSLQDIEALNGVTLGQNVPNPARDYTIVVFEFDRAAEDVSLEIHDLSGRQIQRLEWNNLPAGQHTEIIDTQDLDAGVYVYSLTANGQRQSKRMTVVR